MGKTLRSAGHVALMAGLKQARLDAGLTQAELADRLDRPQSFVAKYENGERRVEVVEFVHIVHAIGCGSAKILESIHQVEHSLPHNL